MRPRGPHLLTGDDPLVAVALGARRERREVGAGARLAEQLAPHLLVAHDRRQEAQPLLLGAVREQRGRGEVEAERVEPAEVERRAARRRRRRAIAGREVEPAVRDRPRRHDEPGRREHRVPGLVVGAGPHLADRGRAAAPARVDPRARHVRVDPRAHRVDRVGHRRARRSRACRSVDVHRPSKLRRRASRGTRPALRGSRRCATTAPARTPRCASCCVERRRRARVQQPLREPERDGRPARELRDQLVDRGVELGAPARARWIAPHVGGFGAATSSRPSSSSSRARTSPTRRGSSQVAPLSGVKPRSVNGSQNRASSAAIVKSAASASWNPMPAAHPRTSHTTGTCTSQQQRDRAGAPASAAGAGCCRRAACAPIAGRALRATMSAPPQKWSPAPSSTITRTRSSVPARVERVDERRASSRRRARCASRAGRA